MSDASSKAAARRATADPVEPATPAPAPAPEPATPAPRTVKSVRLAAAYGYINDDGYQRGWPEDYTVTDAGEIAELMARGAPLKEFVYVD